MAFYHFSSLISGERLDQYLATALPLSRTRIQSLFKTGNVQLNGEVVFDFSKKSQMHQEFFITLPESKSLELIPAKINLDIVFEDEWVVVINKPAGMTVHPGAGQDDNTLVHALLAHCGETLSGIGGVNRPGIVHRLDKDTSGLIVIAKNDMAHQELSKQFETREISRTYWAFVWGVPVPLAGTLQTFIGRSPKNRQKMAVLGAHQGKEAITTYRTLKQYPVTNAHAVSLLECALKTGRTHQIRVHCAWMRHPLVGDSLYGKKIKGTTKNQFLTILDEFPRQALHAKKLSFIHPVLKELMSFETDLPQDMGQIHQLLEGLS